MSFKFLIFLFFLSLNSFANEKRVISLHPTITELLFEIGLQDLIVGTVEYSDFPDKAKNIKRVGDSKINIEKVLALNPTHILGEGYQIAPLKERFKSTQMEFLELDMNTYTDYEINLNKLGKMFSKNATTKKLADDFKSKIKSIQKKKIDTRAVILIENTPLMVAGKNSFLDDTLKICGVQNSFSFLKGYKKINSEELVSRNKELLIVISHQDGSQEIAKRYNFKNFFYYPPNIITRLSSRWPSEVESFCRTIIKYSKKTNGKL